MNMTTSVLRRYTISAPKYPYKAPDGQKLIQDFELKAVERIRAGSPNVTPAWELTFAVAGLKSGRKGIHAGMQIGLLPVNDDERVEKVFNNLRGIPRDRLVALPVCAGAPATVQKLTEKQAIAHTIDLTRPTAKLYDLVAFLRQPGKQWEMPVQGFVDRLRESKMTSSKALYTILSANAHESDQTLNSYLHRLTQRGKLRFSDFAQTFADMGMEIETAEDCKLSVEDFLKAHRGMISFDQLVACQPPLQNRKYTPSEVDKEAGIIKIMVSEVHHEEVVSHTGRKKSYMGTISYQLTQMIQEFLADQKQPQIIHGLLDLPVGKRKDKLPYYQAIEKKQPMILLSTGVGIAPHLAMLREAKANGRSPDVALMLSGVRGTENELAGEEIRKLLGDQKANYHCVDSSRGDHVQDALRAKSDEVWKIMNGAGDPSAGSRKGVIYVCGLEVMQKEVAEVLKDIATTHGKDGDAWVKELEETGRFYASTSKADRFYGDQSPQGEQVRGISGQSCVRRR